MSNPSDWAVERAAQCWCAPTTSRIEMDVVLAAEIAKALDEARAQEREAACEIVRGHSVYAHHPDAPQVGRSARAALAEIVMAICARGEEG